MSGARFTMALAVASALMIALGGGCQAPGPGTVLQVSGPPADAVAANKAVAKDPPPRTEADPATAGIGLFGDLPESTGVPFARQATRGLQQHTFTREGGDFDPDVDPTGRLLVFASTRHSLRPDLYIKSVGGSAVTQLTDDPGSDVQPEVSPDGRRVVFASDRSGNWDIWVTSIDGQHTQQLTKSPRPEIHPSWAPDGERLVYCALNPKTQQWELWVADLRSPGTQKFVAHGLFPRWSPKDDVIAFQRARARGSRWFSIWTIRLVNGEPRFPTEVDSSSDYALIAPTWTADGKQLVYCSVQTAAVPNDGSGQAPTSRGDLWVTDAQGKGKIRLTNGDAINYAPVCGLDGRVYFVSNRSGFENLWSIVPITAPASVADARPAGGTPTPTEP